MSQWCKCRLSRRLTLVSVGKPWQCRWWCWGTTGGHCRLSKLSWSPWLFDRSLWGLPIATVLENNFLDAGRVSTCRAEIIKTFLGNVQCKIVKQLKNSDFYSIFYNETVTANLLKFLQMFPGICLKYRIKCFPSILIWPIQIHQHF